MPAGAFLPPAGFTMLDRSTEGEGPDDNGHPGPPGWGLSVGLTILPRKKSKCYRDLHQKSKLWQQEQRNTSNRINDRSWLNPKPSGSQHPEGRGSVAKGEDQSWLLECTHHASDR